MIRRWARFNTYLLVVLTAGFLIGCRSAEGQRKHQYATLKLHMEAYPDRAKKTKEISVCRGVPISLSVESLAFLDETLIARAVILTNSGVYSIQLQFDQRGTWLLEQYSARSYGKRFAIFSEFGGKPKDAKDGRAFAEARWLAAPLVEKRLGNGLFSFTPDADWNEVDAIVLGLNNMAKKVQPLTAGREFDGK